MSRVERQKERKRMRRKIILCAIACIFLLYWGLTVVDAGTRELLGTRHEGALLKVSPLEKDTIRVDIVGERIVIRKELLNDFIEVFKEKIGRVKKEVLHFQ